MRRNRRAARSEPLVAARNLGKERWADDDDPSERASSRPRSRVGVMRTLREYCGVLGCDHVAHTNRSWSKSVGNLDHRRFAFR